MKKRIKNCINFLIIFTVISYFIYTVFLSPKIGIATDNRFKYITFAGNTYEKCSNCSVTQKNRECFLGRVHKKNTSGYCYVWSIKNEIDYIYVFSGIQYMSGIYKKWFSE